MYCANQCILAVLSLNLTMQSTLQRKQGLPYLTDTHVGPGPHVVGLQVQGLLICSDGLTTLTGIG